MPKYFFFNLLNTPLLTDLVSGRHILIFLFWVILFVNTQNLNTPTSFLHFFSFHQSFHSFYFLLQFFFLFSISGYPKCLPTPVIQKTFLFYFREIVSLEDLNFNLKGGHDLISIPRCQDFRWILIFKTPTRFNMWGAYLYLLLKSKEYVLENRVSKSMTPLKIWSPFYWVYTMHLARVRDKS